MKHATHIFMDVSNSWTKFSAGTLDRIGKVERVLTGSIDKIFLKKLQRKFPESILVISSVVPKKTMLAKKSWNPKKLIVLTCKSKLGIGIEYPNPKSIGADRLANAVAAAHLYSCPAIVIDFGTALTFDIISKKRAYLGGVIAPGLNAMLDYLHDRTALLPKIQLQEPKRAIGKSTTQAMLAGAVFGYRGLVREILKQTEKELKSDKITVVATGGYAKLIARSVTEIQHLHPTLTLEGVRIVAKNEAEK